MHSTKCPTYMTYGSVTYNLLLPSSSLAYSPFFFNISDGLAIKAGSVASIYKTNRSKGLAASLSISGMSFLVPGPATLSFCSLKPPTALLTLPRPLHFLFVFKGGSDCCPSGYSCVRARAYLEYISLQQHPPSLLMRLRNI